MSTDADNHFPNHLHSQEGAHNQLHKSKTSIPFQKSKQNEAAKDGIEGKSWQTILLLEIIGFLKKI